MPTVMIAGANRGIGLEFARQYKADGWRVIATVRDPAKGAELEKLGAEIHKLDVGDFAAVAALGRDLRHETIDVLVCNAGVMGSREATPANPEGDSWLQVLRINTIAPLVVAGAFLEPVKRSSMRKVVAISSRLGSIAQNLEGGLYAYRSSKAGLNAAWKSLAVDEKEIIAAVFHPGWVRTDMGGEQAPVLPAQSVAGLRKVIAGLTAADTGGFFDFTGEKLPW